jgi:hypothetical protein
VISGEEWGHDRQTDRQTDRHSEFRLKSQRKVKSDFSHSTLKLNRRSLLLRTAFCCKLRPAKHCWLLNDITSDYRENKRAFVMSSCLTVFRSYVIFPTPNILSEARKFTRKMCWRFLKVAEIQWSAAQARIFIETGKETSVRELRKLTLRKRLILTVLKLTEGLHWVNVAPGCLITLIGARGEQRKLHSELWGSLIAVKISWTSFLS